MMSDKGLYPFDECAAECVCTSVHSGRTVYLFFLKGKKNVHNRHRGKFTEDTN